MQQTLWRFVFVGLGSFIGGAGINAFLVPHHTAERWGIRDCHDIPIFFSTGHSA